MKRPIILLIFTLSACNAAQEEEMIMLDEPIMEEPALEVAPRLCEPGEIAMQDGIGGTGCKLP